MAEAGRPTDLTEEVLDKIKQGILDGKTLIEIAKIIDKSVDVLYQWHSKNYSGLANLIEGWKRDRKLLLADKNIEKILLLPVDHKDYVRTVNDMTKFVKETLDKENYSKRSEYTGKNGEPLIPDTTQEITDLAEKINELEKNGIHKGTSKPGDGTKASTLGKEVQDKE